LFWNALRWKAVDLFIPFSAAYNAEIHSGTDGCAMDVVEWLKLRTNDARPFTSADIKAVLSEVEWLRAELAHVREERDLARDKIKRLKVRDGPPAGLEPRADGAI
jgi:hypothetical protein